MYSGWDAISSDTVRAVRALRLVGCGRTIPVASGRDEPIRIEADEAPVMTSALAAGLAELVRATMERRYVQEEPAA